MLERENPEGKCCSVSSFLPHPTSLFNPISLIRPAYMQSSKKGGGMKSAKTSSRSKGTFDMKGQKLVGFQGEAGACRNASKPVVCGKLLDISLAKFDSRPRSFSKKFKPNLEGRLCSNTLLLFPSSSSFVS